MRERCAQALIKDVPASYSWTDNSDGTENLAKLYGSSTPVTYVNEPVECFQELLRHRQGHGLLPLAEALNQAR